MIKTLIADDEIHAIERLKELLADYDQFQIIAEAKDGTGALEQIVSMKPDVAFLDINMPGISVFQTISSLNNPPLIIFQTAHSKYATDAFDVDALDYLLKPVSRKRFGQAVTKILEKLSQPHPNQPTPEPVAQDPIEKISLKVQDSIKIISFREIQKICFEEGLTFIYTKEGRFLTDRSLNHYEEKLKESEFFRTSRASLINLNFVSTIHKAFKGSFTVELRDGSTVELSRRKAQLLKKQLDF